MRAPCHGSRRDFLRAAAVGAFCAAAKARAEAAVDAARRMVALARDELWRRFVDRHDVLLDFKEMNRLSPRRREELSSAREAIFAAWVTTLCPDPVGVRRHADEILSTLAHFRADRLRFVSFFPMEAAWYRGGFESGARRESARA